MEYDSELSLLSSKFTQNYPPAAYPELMHSCSLELPVQRNQNPGWIIQKLQSSKTTIILIRPQPPLSILLTGFPLHSELSVPAFGTVVCETQECKSLWLISILPAPFFSIPSELNQPALAILKFQPKVFHSLIEFFRVLIEVWPGYCFQNQSLTSSNYFLE